MKLWKKEYSWPMDRTPSYVFCGIGSLKASDLCGQEDLYSVIFSSWVQTATFPAVAQEHDLSWRSWNEHHCTTITVMKRMNLSPVIHRVATRKMNGQMELNWYTLLDLWGCVLLLINSFLIFFWYMVHNNVILIRIFFFFAKCQ